jgi:hypothetical protein
MPFPYLKNCSKSFLHLHLRPYYRTYRYYQCGNNHVSVANDFSTSASLVKGRDAHLWPHATFYVFDAPLHHHLQYEQRMEALKHAIQNIPQLVLVPIEKCTGSNDLQARLQQAMKNNRGGLILRKPGSFYFDYGSFFSHKVRY